MLIQLWLQIQIQLKLQAYKLQCWLDSLWLSAIVALIADYSRVWIAEFSRQAEVWPGPRVNFKYHEEIGIFCKNGRPGIEPAIPHMSGGCTTDTLECGKTVVISGGNFLLPSDPLVSTLNTKNRNFLGLNPAVSKNLNIFLIFPEFLLSKNVYKRLKLVFLSWKIWKKNFFENP